MDRIAFCTGSFMAPSGAALGQVGSTSSRPIAFRARRRTGVQMGSNAEAFVDEQVKLGGVMIFSKSRCPYCSSVKGLFKDMGADFVVHELDQMPDGREVQDELLSKTGQRTVPNVFIGGEHIGGCDDTMALDGAGQLVAKLEAAGVSTK